MRMLMTRLDSGLPRYISYLLTYFEKVHPVAMDSCGKYSFSFM